MNVAPGKATRRAVVFAYHNVGVRCLRVLLARGVEVALVVTHADNPDETIWFDSVAAVAAEHGIAVLTPASPLEIIERVAAIAPDFIFSFYYRHMLPDALLQLASAGAYNMHGSLLPAYRGRVPVNWAVLKGERETGATLHEMVSKPDAGAILDQTSVPILPDDTAFEVFQKVTVAAEQTLWRVLPGLLDGSAPRLGNDLSRGSYYGGRKPEDGRIDWSRPASEIYNLIRAVAPPYPGAFFDHRGERLIIAAARPWRGASPVPDDADLSPGLHVTDNLFFALCGDGGVLHIKTLLRAQDQHALSPADLFAPLPNP
jgi:methionyl-tRNA formyltransferase